MSSTTITPDSSLRELFDELRPPEGMRVVPVSLPANEGEANLAILITGKDEDSHVLMANLMSYVNELFAVAEQRTADAKILGTDGEPVDSDPKILVP